MMKKFNSPAVLRNFREYLIAEKDWNQPTLIIPAGTCGKAGGADELIRTAQMELSRQKGNRRLNLRITGCHGYCEAEPSVLIEPDRTFYPKVNPKNLIRIIEATVAGGYVEEYLYRNPKTGAGIRRQEDVPFFKKQVRILLSRNEKVEPTHIESYIENGGYASLAQVLEKQNPIGVIEEVKRSGLRGRGGAGFPTGMKWERLAAQSSQKGKFLVCNADEGDPGAYMDRSVLEGNPQSILEGMLIGAFATGATEGIIYVRNEYPLAIQHLEIALQQAQELGLLGENILGSGFSFPIQMVKGAGAFVCGEETALIRSIEGTMGEPRQRPPYPVQQGIGNRPTAINNVETWANIPILFQEGGEAFAKIGTPKNSGTKIFSLVGKIKNTGLVEVPMGIRIREIVYEIGGADDGDVIKAVQTGGPSGGCIPQDQFDLPIDYESLQEAGSIMGSGGMIVMDEHTCMVDVAKYFMNFLKEESCGKCFTCRKGTQRMYEILDDFTQKRGRREQLELLEELAEMVKDTTLCGLGQTASNPVISTLRYFRNEYLEHIENHRCPAGVCKALITFSINENCKGCQACLRVCPTHAISGEKEQRHVIDLAACIKCGTCKTVCRYGAVTVA